MSFDSAPSTLPGLAAAPKPGGAGSATWRRLRQQPATLAAAWILGLLVMACSVGPWLLPWKYDQLDFEHVSSPPSIASGHWLGTDSVGRDLLARSLHGGQISLLVGAVATAVSLLIGVTWGALAGYFGGRLDEVMMRIVDILYALPFMFLVILLMVLFGRSLLLIFIALGAIQWLDMARIVRGQTLALRQTLYVEAARASGLSESAILWRHVLPHLLGVVAVYVTLTLPQVILAESFLSFLGLGVQEPLTSWGALVNEGAADMQSAPWALLVPASLLATALFCFNFIGDGLRDAFDPHER